MPRVVTEEIVREFYPCEECGADYTVVINKENGKQVRRTVNQHSERTCKLHLRDKKRKEMTKGKVQHLRFVVPYFADDSVRPMCAKGAGWTDRNYQIAEVPEDMNCKKCYWQLFKLGLMTEEKHQVMVRNGQIHQRFIKWQRWSEIA